MSTALWVVEVDGVRRVATGDSQSPFGLLDPSFDIDGALTRTGPSLLDMTAAPVVGEVPARARRLSPLGGQPIWGAGVTYTRSREARIEEAVNPTCYETVYDAARPELFFKALPRTARGDGETIGIRVDSTWDVPEPELAIVIDATGVICGFSIANDVSSRSIEGENPLYLPQAKTYRWSCAIGPCIVPVEHAPHPDHMTITLTCQRAGSTVFSGQAAVALMKRSFGELRDWIMRADEHPKGVVLMTGTPIVPEPEFTLQAGDIVSITISGLGTLTNTVETVGQ